jgi:hypothetical protein
LCAIKKNITVEKWIDPPKSGNVKVETEVKEKVNRVIENRKSRKENFINLGKPKK